MLKAPACSGEGTTAKLLGGEIDCRVVSLKSSWHDHHKYYLMQVVSSPEIVVKEVSPTIIPSPTMIPSPTIMPSPTSIPSPIRRLSPSRKLRSRKGVPSPIVFPSLVTILAPRSTEAVIMFGSIDCVVEVSTTPSERREPVA